MAFIGVGEPEWEEVSSTQLDLLALPGYEMAVAEALWDELRSRRSQWDVAAFDYLLESSTMATHFLSAARRDGAMIRQRSIGFDYYIDLPATYPDYLRSLESRARQRLKSDRSKIEKAGKLTIGVCTTAAEVPAALRELRRLHESRQAVKGRAGAFQSRRFVRFHETFAAESIEQNLVELGVATLDGQNVSGWLNYRFKGRTSAYLSGYDDADARIRSPGRINNSYRIERAIQRGDKTFDFLRGDLGSYKSEYGCVALPMLAMTVYNSTIPAMLRRSSERALSELRVLKRRWTRPNQEL